MIRYPSGTVIFSWVDHGQTINQNKALLSYITKVSKKQPTPAANTDLTKQQVNDYSGIGFMNGHRQQAMIANSAQAKHMRAIQKIANSRIPNIHPSAEGVVQMLRLVEQDKVWSIIPDEAGGHYDAEEYTENFTTLAEYAKFKEGKTFADTVEAQMDADIKERLAATKEAPWYKKALHMGLNVDGLLKNPHKIALSGTQFEQPLPMEQVMFHGTTRTPAETFKEGFNTKYEREGKDKPIEWRTGFDDVELESAVCLARDVRGSAFFPLTKAPKEGEVPERKPIYLYAIRLPEGTPVVNTYDAQKAAEHYETGSAEPTPDRFRYDPAYEDDDSGEGPGASCIWQFQEHAVKSIDAGQIVGIWKVERSTMIEAEVENREIAGVKFRIVETDEFKPLEDTDARIPAAEHAQRIASQYKAFYPRHEGHFLSYMGIVKKKAEAEKLVPASFAEAKGIVESVKPVVANEEHPGLRDD